MFLDYNGWIFIGLLLASALTCFVAFKFVSSLYKADLKKHPILLTTYSILVGSSLSVSCFLFTSTLKETNIEHLTITDLLISLLFTSLIGYATLNTANKKVLPVKSLLSGGLIVSFSALCFFYFLIKAYTSNQLGLLVLPTILATLICFSISVLIIITLYWLKSYEGSHQNKVKILFSTLMAIGILSVQIAYSTGVYNLSEPAESASTNFITMLFAMLLILAFLTAFIILIFYDRLAPSIDKTINFKNSYPINNIYESFDSLTKLPNRNALNEHLLMAAKKCDRTGDSMALAYIDLDHFKPVNDYFGHHVGDLLLVEVAERFNTAIRNCDYIARTGGDEFVAILGEIDAHESIIAVVQRIIDAVKEPFYIEGHLIEISCSVGIAIYPRDGNLEKLKVNADAAMYKAKENGRDQFRFYDAEIEQASDEMQQIRKELIDAINENQFILHYQPKIMAQTQAPAGAEALLRWDHPERGILTPIHFIEAAERFGFVDKINNLVLIQACKTIHKARKEGLDIQISVNLSRQQFRNPQLVEYIRAVMQQYDIQAHSLIFEISETHAIHNQNQFKKLLSKFKFARLKISIDDFGLHPFSLTYLQNLEVSEVKLDKSFTAGIANYASSLAIVDAVVRLAHALNLNVVAEGIETEAQRSAIQTTGCNQMQGYYFSKPVSQAELFEIYHRLYETFNRSGKFLVSDYMPAETATKQA
ncbi:MAG: EAL domain-containing protein [Methylophilus sp.]